ncbi:rho GTPase-activating protein 33-like isoform X2 [Bolinopsis microptera]|uniref:rho GTPase-activating protein 33-like isoform X2 n=1 Tax=Bolinopsis microptera TaxID=2820187 RepID=UPI003078B6BA
MTNTKVAEGDQIPRKQVGKGRKLHRLSIDTYPGRSLIQLNRESRADEWVQLPPSHIRHTWISGPKFPKLDECTHFHYDRVTLPDDFTVSLRTEHGDHELQLSGETTITVFYIHVTCNKTSWTITRRYSDAVTFDIQLHRCIFDRRYSMLPTLSKENDIPGPHKDAFEQLSYYFERFTKLVREAIHLKCGSILNWLEMDNRGHHFLWHVNSAINVPAIAVATVTRNYVKREDDELELRVGDLVSIIDMPNAKESPWWRGKHSNKVGFFPSSCVEVIPGSIHDNNVRKPPTRVNIKTCDVVTDGTPDPATGPEQGIKKKKRLKSRLAVLFASRPDRDALRQKGILRGRVFGAHLSEHLFDTDMSVPLIVQVCCSTVEEYGVVEGVYRKPGIVSNVQRLRQEFDHDNPPTRIQDERYIFDIHCVASLCKMYFRELPDPLLTFQLYDHFAEAVSFPTVEMKLQATRRVVQQLPPFHYSTLAFLARHLSTLAAQSSIHGMHSRNLALVWAPNLLKPQTSDSDASAFTEIKIQSVVLQFLIDHAKLIFADEEPQGTPSSVRFSVGSQITTGSCTSPADNMSQTSSVQLVHFAGIRAQRRNVNRLSFHDSAAGTETPDKEAEAGVVRSRTTSDLTHVTTSTTANKYQYLMKIPLMELAEAQRAHAVSEVDVRTATGDPAHKPAGLFRRRDNKKKKVNGTVRYSQEFRPTSSHWARSILNKFSIKRSASYSHRPVISGPCGFVSDPYSTVLNDAQSLIPGVGLERTEAEHNSVSSKLSSFNGSGNNVLLLGNVTKTDANSAVDKSDFVSEWCNDTIKQFLDGKPLASIQPTNVTDRASIDLDTVGEVISSNKRSSQCCTGEDSPVTMIKTQPSPPARCDLRRSRSLPHKRRNKRNEDIAYALRGEKNTEQVRQKFNAILGYSTNWQNDQNSSSKRSSVDLEDELNEARPAKLPRPLSCPSYGAENVTPLIRKSRSFRNSSANVLLIQQQRCSLTLNTNSNKSPHLIV